MSICGVDLESVRRLVLLEETIPPKTLVETVPSCVSLCKESAERVGALMAETAGAYCAADNGFTLRYYDIDP